MPDILVDHLPPHQQRLISLLPKLLPYRLANWGFTRLTKPSGPREAYLASMRLEVFWLNPAHLKHEFVHRGVDHIDPAEPYVMTSLHFGHWAMYPASLNQQYGIKSQVVASGRNRMINGNTDHFWYYYGHRKQYLSGHPPAYSTDSFYEHVKRLRSGRSLVVIADVREQGLAQKETAVDFLGAPFYVQRTVPLLARRAGARILPYVGHYDDKLHKHLVTWFPPLSAAADDQRTLQQIMALLEPEFSAHLHQYFNVLDSHRQPFC